MTQHKYILTHRWHHRVRNCGRKSIHDHRKHRPFARPQRTRLRPCAEGRLPCQRTHAQHAGWQLAVIDPRTDREDHHRHHRTLQSAMQGLQIWSRPHAGRTAATRNRPPVAGRRRRRKGAGGAPLRRRAAAPPQRRRHGPDLERSRRWLLHDHQCADPRQEDRGTPRRGPAQGDNRLLWAGWRVRRLRAAPRPLRAADRESRKHPRDVRAGRARYPDELPAEPPPPISPRSTRWPRSRTASRPASIST